MNRPTTIALLIATLAFSSQLWGQSQPPSPPSSESTGVLEEVVVTAEKRAENIQRVPIAITAFTAAALQDKGVTDIHALSNLTPNVNLDEGSPFSASNSVLSASIRGIGQDDFAFNLDPGVGVYVDGVYLARTVGANQNLLDVDRVEILKGPQGTLFGRNTIGGAINIVTRTPGDTFQISGEATGGAYHRRDVAFTVDLPISDHIKSVFTASSAERDGYQNVIPYTAGRPYLSDSPDSFEAPGQGTAATLGGQNQQAMRGKVLWLASEELQVTVGADWTHEDQPATASTLLQAFPGGAGNLAAAYNACIAGAPALFCVLPRATVGTTVTSSNSLAYGNQFIAPNIDETYATGNNFSRLDAFGSTIIVDWSGPYETHIKSITGYRGLDWKVAFDADGSPITINQPDFAEGQHQRSEELQLTGKALENRLDYVAGLYYFNEHGFIHDLPTFAGGLFQVDGQNLLNTNSYAAYTHLNYKITENLGVTVGGRYSVDKKTLEGFQTDVNGFIYKSSGCYPYNASAALIGGPANLTCQQALGYPVPGQPDRLYPAGVNHQTFDNVSPTAGINYQITRDDLIYASWSKGFKDGGWTTRLTQGVPVAPTFGPEHAETAEVGAKTQWLDQHLQMNVAAFFTKYEGIQLTFVPPGSISPTFQNAGRAHISGLELETQAVANEYFRIASAIGYTHARYVSLDPAAASSGLLVTNKLPKTPDLKINIGPEFGLPLPNDAKMILTADYTYTASLYNDAINTPLLRRPVTNVVGASIRYQTADSRYQLVLGATNLTDDRYLTTGLDQANAGAIYGTYNAPRQWYLTLRAKSR